MLHKRKLLVGSSLATRDDAWEAARMAGFDDDIRAMPMGLSTMLSEGAGTLSGGQRQRLLIARAIVHRSLRRSSRRTPETPRLP